MRFNFQCALAIAIALSSVACGSLKSGSGEDAGGINAGGATGGAAGLGGSGGAAGLGGAGGGGAGGAGGSGAGGNGGSGGSGGDGGGQPPDPCEVADCDDHAACSVANGSALCQCLSPYIGDGATCMLDVQCEMLDCGDNTACVGEAGARRCECVADFMLVGDVCEHIDDCEPNPCVRGECMDLVEAFECMCPDGWDGDTCEIDECEATTCDPGQTCVTGPTCVPTCTTNNSCAVGVACIEMADCSGGGACTSSICHPSCAGSCGDEQVCVDDGDCSSDYCARDTAGTPTGICRPACARTGCDTGDACTRADDCSSGNCTSDVCHPACAPDCEPGDSCVSGSDCDGLDTCHADDKVCLSACAGGTIASNAEIDAKLYCHTINGDLTISPNAGVNTIGPDRLPYLETINGALRLYDGLTISSITLPELTDVTGYFGSGLNNVGEIHMPKLEVIGTFGVENNALQITASMTNVVDMPALRTVYGAVNISYCNPITSIDLGSLSFIQENLEILGAPELTTLDLASLNSRSDISGFVTLDYLPRIRWSSIDFMESGQSGDRVADVGCDTISECNCDGSMSCFP